MWCNSWQGKKESVKNYSFLVCAGAPEIGKTSFIDHAIHLMLKEESPKKSEFSEVVKRSREYPVFYLNFNSIPLNYQDICISTVAACMAHEIYVVYNPKCSLEEIVTTFQEELKRFTINTITKLLETNEEGKYFVFLHLDDVQKLFSSMGTDKDKHKSYYYRIITQIFMAVDSLNSNLCLVPMLSGTNALGIHQAFSKSGLSYKSISLELLKRNHFVNILNDLYDFKLEIPEKFLELVDLLEGHPRLFTLTISLASQVETIINSQDINERETREINLKFKEEVYNFPEFNKEGFLNFLSHLSQEDGFHICWNLLKRINTEFLYRLPEVQTLFSNEDKTMLIRENVILSCLEERSIRRFDIVTMDIKFSDLEDDGMIYLDPVARNEFKVKCPFPLLLTCYSPNLKIANEPILSTEKVLDSYTNERQDLPTLANRMVFLLLSTGRKVSS